MWSRDSHKSSRSLVLDAAQADVRAAWPHFSQHRCFISDLFWALKSSLAELEMLLWCHTSQSGATKQNLDIFLNNVTCNSINYKAVFRFLWKKQSKTITLLFIYLFLFSNTLDTFFDCLLLPFMRVRNPSSFFPFAIFA